MSIQQNAKLPILLLQVSKKCFKELCSQCNYVLSRNSNFYAELRNCCVNSNNNNSHCFNLIQLADAFGPHICVLKTHIDVVSDFTAEISEKLKGLAQKYNFIIMEDR